MNEETADQHEVFLTLFTANEAAIRAFVRRLVPTRRDTADVMQGIALVLWRKFDELDDRDGFRKWAFRVARYESPGWIRDKCRDRNVLSEDVLNLVADESTRGEDRLTLKRAKDIRVLPVFLGLIGIGNRLLKLNRASFKHRTCPCSHRNFVANIFELVLRILNLVLLGLNLALGFNQKLILIGGSRSSNTYCVDNGRKVFFELNGFCIRPLRDHRTAQQPHQFIQSRANIFGGFDYSSANGKKWSSRANIFGGQDHQGPSGQRVTSRANIFGGQDYQGRNYRGSSRANIFGGQDYHGPKGQRSSSRRNIFGGQDYQGRSPYIFGGNK